MLVQMNSVYGSVCRVVDVYCCFDVVVKTSVSEEEGAAKRVLVRLFSRSTMYIKYITLESPPPLMCARKDG